jgi:AP-1 complex subunit gamma-1
MNADNVKPLTKELITYLIGADADFKGDLASRICLAIDKFAPDKRWHVDNTVKVLLLAGNHVSDEIVFALCHLVAGCAELHAYAVHKLFYTLADPDLVQPDAIVLVATWLIGEYGHVLPIAISDILDLFDEVLRRALAAAADQAAAGKSASQAKLSATTIAEYVVMALAKLLIKSRQLGVPVIKNRVEATLRRFDGALAVDLQQRVCELLVILSPAWDDSTRVGLVDVMPACEKSTAAADKPVGDSSVSVAIPVNAEAILEHVRAAAQTKGALATKKRTFKEEKKQTSGGKVTGGFDLDDLLGEATVIPAQAAVQSAPKVSDDLLNDLFG